MEKLESNVLDNSEIFDGEVVKYEDKAGALAALVEELGGVQGIENTLNNMTQEEVVALVDKLKANKEMGSKASDGMWKYMVVSMFAAVAINYLSQNTNESSIPNTGSFDTKDIIAILLSLVSIGSSAMGIKNIYNFIRSKSRPRGILKSAVNNFDTE